MRGRRPGASNQLRIIGGRWRGRRLKFPDAPGLRPTPDRVRETLFNWLAPIIEGARCLDLFAGSGALGLEALSRGASEVVFVERDRKVAQTLRENLKTLGANAEVHQADALTWLVRHAPAKSPSLEKNSDPIPPFEKNSDAVPPFEKGGLGGISSPAETTQAPGSKPFDIVFLDPPFGQNLLTSACEKLKRYGWLKPGARVYLESESEWVMQVPENWVMLIKKQAGQVTYRLMM